MTDLKFYVWRGEGVLRNYSTGIAAVLATDVDDAWDSLMQNDFAAYWYLKTGRRLYIYGDENRLGTHASELAICQDEEEYGGLDNPQHLYPIEPVEYALEAAPILVQWGGD